MPLIVFADNKIEIAKPKVDNISFAENNINIDVVVIPRIKLIQRPKYNIFLQIPIHRDIYSHEYNNVGIEFVLNF